MRTGTFEYHKYNSMRAGTFQYCMMMVTLGGGSDERIERHVSVTGEVSIGTETGACRLSTLYIKDMEDSHSPAIM